MPTEPGGGKGRNRPAMLSMPKNWGEMPSSVKNAILSLLVGWAAHYVFYFGFIAADQPERVTYLNLGVGIGICYCVATIRKWARRLCIYFNIVMVPMYTLFAVAFAQGGKVNLFILTALCAVTFAYSLYYLLQKETLKFFTPPEENNEQQPHDSSRGPKKGSSEADQSEVQREKGH